MIENRKFRMSPGWYYVHCSRTSHTGVSQDKWYREHYPDSYPGFQSFYSWKGCIVGAAYVAHHLPHEACKDDVFACADYPIKNIITQTIDFNVAVPCNGFVGTWPLLESVRTQMQEVTSQHLSNNSILKTGAEVTYPPNHGWESKSKCAMEEVTGAVSKQKSVKGAKSNSNNKSTIKKTSLPKPIPKPIYKSKLFKAEAPTPRQIQPAERAPVTGVADIRQFFGK